MQPVKLIANSARFHIMKNFLLLILALAVFAAAGCSRSEDKTTVKPQSTPDAERLKSDSQRLQQATANAAREREKAAAQASASPSATP
jgi:nitrous oxide reductase accessory protein NosL